MKTITGERVEFKFSPTKDGWHWDIAAVVGGFIVATSANHPDRARAKRALKSELREMGVVR